MPISLPTGGQYAVELNAMLRLALETGAMLLRMRHGPNAAWRKQDMSWVSEADQAAAAWIDEALHREFPHDAILNEETHLTHRAASEWRTRDRCFMVDPLDSTNSYLMGHPHYGVILALCERGVPVAGVTYKPELGEMYVAAAQGGAWRTFAGPAELESDTKPAWQPIRVSGEGSLSLVTSHGRVTPGLQDLLHRLGQPPTQRMRGALKINEVARGEYTAFLSPAENAMNLWDIAAPGIILAEAGGTLTDLNGVPIDWRSSEPVLQKGLVASNGKVHETLLQRLQRPASQRGANPASSTSD
jgi:3'-phosphoadenosine 5'-phosphosulfate (PAPS) 3'-phosphatase